MKAIRLVKIHVPLEKSDYIKGNLYSVYLGNSVTRYFSNIKQAKQFLADTNRFLNDNLQECNFVYIALFSIYRENWFLFWDIRAKYNSGLISWDNSITASLQQCDEMFNRLVKNTGGPNASSWAWKFFEKLLTELSNILNILEELFLNRNNYINVNKLKIIRAQLKRIRIEIENYGKEPEKPQ